jgi:hypothetical protein
LISKNWLAGKKRSLGREGRTTLGSYTIKEIRDFYRPGFGIFPWRRDWREKTDGRFGMRKKVLAVIAFVQRQHKDVPWARHHRRHVLACGRSAGRITRIAGVEIELIGQLSGKETQIGHYQCDLEDQPMPAICLESQGRFIIYLW